MRMTSPSKLINVLQLIRASIFFAIFPLMTNQLPNPNYGRLPWYDAYLSCSKDGYHLPVPKETNFSDLDALLPSNTSEEWMWIGGRSVHTSWRWSDGCRVEREEGCVEIHDLSTSRNTAADSPFDCLIRCGSTFVALQGSRCYCLNRKPATFITKDHCHLRCADNFLLRCGGIRQGTNYASVYRLLNSSVDWDMQNNRNLNENCAYLSLESLPNPTPSHLRLATGDCFKARTGFRQPLCQRCSERNDSCIVFRNNSYQSWRQAWDYCKQLGGELLNVWKVRTRLESLPLIMTPNQPESYWVALWRDRLHMWINGTMLMAAPTNESGFCMAAKREAGSNTVKIATKDCSYTLPFLCLNVTDMEARFEEVSSQQSNGTCSDSETSPGPPVTTSSDRFYSSTGKPAATGYTGYRLNQSVHTSPVSTASVTWSRSTVTGYSHTGLGSSVPVSTTIAARLTDSTARLVTNRISTRLSTAGAELSSVKSSEATITTFAPETATEAQSTTATKAQEGKTASVSTEARETTRSRSTIAGVSNTHFNSFVSVSTTSTTALVTKVVSTILSTTDTKLPSVKSSVTAFTTSTAKPATKAEEVTRPTEMTYLDPKNSTPNQKVEPTPDDDFLPLYIVIGILIGLALSLIIIAVGVYKWRSRRRHSFRRRTSEDSRSEWVLQQSPSDQGLRTDHEIETDPKFRFVETH